MRYNKRHTSITWFFFVCICVCVYLLFIVAVVVFYFLLSRSSIVVISRHTIDELNLWIEMENHKKSPIEYRFNAGSVWQCVTQCRNAMNEHFYAHSETTFLDRTFFGDLWMSFRFEREKKKANKKRLPFIVRFFLSFVCNDIRIVRCHSLVKRCMEKKLIEIEWLKAKL